MSATELTANQIHALSLIHSHGCSGDCVNYRWMFKVGSENITGAVRSLQNKGYVDVSYYSGGTAGVNLTQKGRDCFEPTRRCA